MLGEWRTVNSHAEAQEALVGLEDAAVRFRSGWGDIIPTPETGADLLELAHDQPFTFAVDDVDRTLHVRF